MTGRHHRFTWAGDDLDFGPAVKGAGRGALVWEHDLRIAGETAGRVKDALGGAVDAGALARGWAEAKARTPALTAAEYLASAGVREAFDRALAPVIAGTWAEAYELGQLSARDHLGKGEGDVALFADPVAERLNKALAEAVVTKVGPKGYVHGWRYVGAPGAADSLSAHTRADGTLEPEREALHARIVERVLAGHAAPKGRPELTFLGGGPASGKSTVMSGDDGADRVVIDADGIKGMLPEYRGRIAAGDKTAAAYVHEESSALAKRIMKEAMSRRLNITLDGTGDSAYAKLAAKVDAARKAGYGITGKYVTVDTDEAVRRANARAAKTGRMVPESTVREIHGAVTGTFRQAIENNLFDKAELWDNNGTAPSQVGSKDAGGAWRVGDQAAWKRFLAKEHEG